MTNEEMQKTIEFILEQQAQFVTRVQKDEERLTRLEDAFTTLVNIARITDERLDVVEQLAKELDQDPSQFNWKSKGFLEVW